ncbi:MAG: ATPase, T2SS/T4P/T4SS family [Desulfobacteraceae bacterium]|jgi:pilus assembly protein CpaF|nr:ATPase, T2SS/T4P/T4SS family [Desulfobacteraceae bacterium]
MIIISIQPLDRQIEPQIKRIHKSELKIGRAPENDIVLEDSSVSQNHAELIQKNNGYNICDLISTNGTLINDQPITPMKKIPLDDGVGFVIGKFLLKVNNNVSAAEGQFDQPRSGLKTIIGDVCTPDFEVSDKNNCYRNLEYVELKKEVRNRLLSIIDLRRLDIKKLSDDELRNQCLKIVQKIIRDKKQTIPAGVEENEFLKDVLDEALGLGPLEDLIDDPSVSEIMVNCRDQIYVEQNGRLSLSPKIFTDDQSVLNIIARIISPIGRRIDESSPMVDARLKDGSRVNAVIPPLALNGPCITIRKFSKNPLSAEDLIKAGSLSRSMIDFIKVGVKVNKNIIISGGTVSGKTTLLNLFSSFIPKDVRLVTIEDAAELQLQMDHLIRLESRPPNIEGKGEIKIRDLVRNALRMRPDRIIVGECRGGEALDMLQAMNTGHDGSMTTAHANTPRDMISRLETMVLMAGEDLPSRAIREQIASAVDIIVQQTRFSCGARKITNITEVIGIEDDRVILQDIFYFKQEGLDADQRTTGKFIATGWIPLLFEEMKQRGLESDMDIFHN